MLGLQTEDAGHERDPCSSSRRCGHDHRRVRLVESTLVSIVVGGLLGVTVLALVDRYCRGMDR